MMEQIKLLDHGYVQFIESWGSDERVIESARMSTSGGFKGWGPFCKHCKDVDYSVVPFTDTCPVTKDAHEEVPGDEKLLRFLWENKHHTPFEMAGMTIEVQAPIFVFREWHRHRTQSYNEMSGRYAELPDMCYIPSIERLMAGKQATKNKQSSEAGFTGAQAYAYQELLRETYAYSRNHYNELLRHGVAKELARLVLPVSIYSKMRASANLRNWLGFLSLRMDAAAQWEIRQYAEQVAGLVAEKFPRTYQLFKEETA
jgi:thymidylate synthase (FAD)